MLAFSGAADHTIGMRPLPRTAACLLSAAALFLLPAAKPAAETVLSVLYFANTGADAEFDWMRKGLADMVAGDLAELPGYRLVEREELQRVLAEQELSLSGLLDESKAPKLGKLLSAELLVYGSFAVLGPDIRMDAKAVRVETGELVGAASSVGRKEAALELERELASKLAAALGGAGRSAAAAGGTDSLAAAGAYYRGLDLFDQGRFGDAAELFGESSRADPAYLKPGLGLEAAYRYLKDFRSQRQRREMNALAADIAALEERIGAPLFYSFGQAVMNPTAFGWKDAAEVTEFYRSRPMVLNGETPVQAIFYLQHLLGELGRKAVDYFGDDEFDRRCGDRILRWTAEAERRAPMDPFLPEVLYQGLIVHRFRNDWPELKRACERLMGDFPDYRMMPSVEEFYELALEKLME